MSEVTEKPKRKRAAPKAGQHRRARTVRRSWAQGKCKAVQQFVARIERERKIGTVDGFTYDAEIAERAVRFVEENIVLYEAEHFGKPVKLLDFQKEILRELWGWRNAEGRRRYRKAFIFLPKGSGKSALSAMLVILNFVCGDHGQKLYCAATSQKQAKIVFDDCCEFMQHSPTLKKMVASGAIALLGKRAIRAAINTVKNNRLEPLSDDSSQDGLRPAFCVVDEMHKRSVAKRDVLQMILNSASKLDNSQIVMITTAGTDLNSPGYDEYKYAKGVLDGTIKDDRYLAFISEADPELAWDDPKAFAQADVAGLVKREHTKKILKEAKAKPREKAAFIQHFLNRWQPKGGDEAWLAFAKWEACRGDFTDEEMEGRECWLGVDLANSVTDRSDLNAVVQVFTGKRPRALFHFFMPEGIVAEKASLDGAPYEDWAEQGLLQLIPDGVYKDDFIAQYCDWLAEEYKVLDRVYDPKNAAYLENHWKLKNQKHVNFMYSSYDRVIPRLETDILNGNLEHNGNPIADWCFQNIRIRKGANDRLTPEKLGETRRIDGIVALMMAYLQVVWASDKPEPPPPPILPHKNLRAILGF